MGALFPLEDFDRSKQVLSRCYEVKQSADKLTCLVLQVLTHEGESLPRYPLSMEIIDPEADNIPCDTEDNQDGTYTVTFTPQISGAHLCKGNCLFMHHHWQTNMGFGVWCSA